MKHTRAAAAAAAAAVRCHGSSGRPVTRFSVSFKADTASQQRTSCVREDKSDHTCLTSTHAWLQIALLMTDLHGILIGSSRSAKINNSSIWSPLKKCLPAAVPHYTWETPPGGRGVPHLDRSYSGLLRPRWGQRGVSRHLSQSAPTRARTGSAGDGGDNVHHEGFGSREGPCALCPLSFESCG